MALLIFPACFGLAAIMPEVLPLLFGRDFAPAVPTAMILVCAAAIPAAANVGSNMLWAMDRTDLDFYTGLAGVFISVICGITIIPAFGPIGAAYARVLTQITVVFLNTALMAMKLGIRPPLRDLLKLLLAALGCALVARASIVLLPGIGGIPVAILAGAVAYAVCLRLLSAIPAEDAMRIRSLANSLPQSARGFVDVSLKLVTR
jgi:O-antigen/teichoic acid export membrane protein